MNSLGKKSDLLLLSRNKLLEGRNYRTESSERHEYSIEAAAHVGSNCPGSRS